MAKETLQFQAEVKQILDLMVHSLYSQREIFLRELISNASDALDKFRLESLTNSITAEGEPSITITPNPEAKTLTISDNGIGMTFEEVQKNIGTIAHSGTKEFLKAQKEKTSAMDLIGQFGVGFYSSFMVADQVLLHTQKAGQNDGVYWESKGDGTYSIAHVPRPEGTGTTITLKLKDFSSEEDAQDFTDEWTLRSLIKKYSDFISFPIKLKTEDKEKKGEFKEEVINSQKALWLRSPSEIKPEEYKEFYHHVSHDWAEPLKTIHYKAEGTQEFSALLFVPSQVPYDYNYRETKFGLNLYVKRVFIMDHCEDLIPHYLRFVKGVIDSSDLSLNVSREILQKDQQVQGIRKALVGKVLGTLKDLHKKERPEYEKFWGLFGASIKEGVATDHSNKEKLQDLCLFKSTHSDQWTSLEEYIGRMKEGQKDIYFLTGDSLELLKQSPHLEKIKEKGFEVILMTDPVDEWVTQELREYKDKKLVSVTSSNLDIETEAEKKAKEEELKQVDEKFKDIKTFILETLKEQIKEVKISDRLVDSPVCLVSDSSDPSARMSRLMEAMGQAVGKSKRILEINPKHKIFEKIQNLKSETHKQEWVEILYNQALLAEGSPIEDAAKFSRQIANLMVEA